MERIQKLLSAAGVASRREAEEWIRAGRLTVDGQVAALGTRADPATQDIRLDGQPLPTPPRHRYYALNKPKGYTSTRSDPHATRTVTELLQSVPDRLYPVGRLDVDSEGLLLLTNDGDFAYRLTHPRFEVPKTYDVWVKGDVHPKALQQLRTGVDLEDGRTAPAEVRVVERVPSHRSQPWRTRLEIVLREGRKRQVRRMCAAVGFPVLELTRVRIGPLELGHLKPGRFRALSPSEVAALLRAAGPAERDRPPAGRPAATAAKGQRWRTPRSAPQRPPR